MSFNCPRHAKVPGAVTGLFVLQEGSCLRRRQCKGYLLHDTDALLLLAWWGLFPPLSSAWSIPPTSALGLRSPPRH